MGSKQREILRFKADADEATLFMQEQSLTVKNQLESRHAAPFIQITYLD
ncbi:MAG: hypothetical protein IPL60_06025 [Ardenticatenia bacterium]|nr:hypothetical protein [Ardenticatenia bacterium]